MKSKKNDELAGIETEVFRSTFEGWRDEEDFIEYLRRVKREKVLAESEVGRELLKEVSLDDEGEDA